MEMIAVAIGLVGCGAVFAWWDISKRKVGAGLSLDAIDGRVDAIDVRVSDIEKLSLDTRNKVAGLTTIASSNLRRR
jgi:hypothetical protein